MSAKRVRTEWIRACRDGKGDAPVQEMDQVGIDKATVNRAPCFRYCRRHYRVFPVVNSQKASSVVNASVDFAPVLARLAGLGSEVIHLETLAVASPVEIFKARHRPDFAQALTCSMHGEFLSGLEVMLNGASATFETVLSQGDRVLLLLAFAGG